MTREELKAQQGALESVVQAYEGQTRSLQWWAAHLVQIVAVGMALFHLYTASFGVMEAIRQRAIHYVFFMALLFFLYPGSKGEGKGNGGVPWYDVLLSVVAVVSGWYILANWGEIVFRAGLPTTADTLFGIIAIVVVLEAARRVTHPVLPLVASVFMAYALLGPYMPGLFAHRGVTIPRLVEHLYLTTEGIFGIPLSVSATFVFLFIMFGAFLEATGAGQFFIDLAKSLVGWTRGGPAKIAIFASGILGSINGSSTANVVTTGSFTIPLMKKVGFRPHVAGGVEVAASSTGQYLPPIMGAAAFVMAEITGIPYVQIAVAAAIPAILDYVTMFTQVHLEAMKYGIEGIPRSELPKFWPTLAKGWHLLIPVAGIIASLLSGNTPLRAGMIGIVLTVAASWLRPWSRLGVRDLLEVLEKGARNSIGVAAACASAGLIVGVVTLTGIGLKLSDIVISFAGDSLILAMILTGVASMILGMGMPTTATYIILATITAPILGQFGVPLIAAHLFVLYYGTLADDTPPVGLAAYAAAGVAKSDPWLTGWQGFKFDASGLLLPMMFVFTPQLLLIDVTVVGLIHALVTAVIGMACLAAAIQNFALVQCRLYERLMLLGAAFSLVDAGALTDVLGLSLAGAVIVLQWIRRDRSARIGPSEAVAG